MKEENKPNEMKILPITQLEKIVLKNKIFKSVDKIATRKKYNRITMGMAFSLAFMIGFGFYFFNKPSSSLTDFVKSSKGIVTNNSNEVTLIYGEDENLSIDEEITTISYSNTGQKVTIGNTKEISQKTSKNNKIVYNTLLVPYGKRSKINLSDGSTVWLNSGSKMIFPATFIGDKREVYLEGEAIFDVEHNANQPFIVISEDQEIEVLGTVFGVTNYADENAINTVLKSGSVQISYKSDFSSSSIHADKMKISPGTKASYNKKTKSIVSEKVNVDNYFSWRDGVLIFRNDDLQYITRKISRYYNLKIDIEDDVLSGETFSGYLDLNENIDNVLQNIKASTNMNYTYKEDKIIIN